MGCVPAEVTLSVKAKTFWLTRLFLSYRGVGKDGSMGQLYGKFSLIDLAGRCFVNSFLFCSTFDNSLLSTESPFTVLEVAEI